MVSLNLSNIKCKPKDDKTKCIVKNDDSSLIVSLKLPSIRLTTSNPKKDYDVIHVQKFKVIDPHLVRILSVN